MKICKYIRHEDLTPEMSRSWMLLKQDKHDTFHLFLNIVGTRPVLLLYFPVVSWPLSKRVQPPTFWLQELKFLCLLWKETLQTLQEKVVPAVRNKSCYTQGDRAGPCSGTGLGALVTAPQPSAQASSSYPDPHLQSRGEQEVLADGDGAIPPPPQERLFQWVRMTRQIFRMTRQIFSSLGVTWGRVPAVLCDPGADLGGTESWNQLFKAHYNINGKLKGTAKSS